jgi:6-phosphofructokinase 1
MMISMQGGHFVPIPFRDLIDPVTGRTRVRLVDIATMKYAIGRRYMIRLRKDDFDDPSELARIAAVTKLSLQEFRDRFEYLVESEPPAVDLMTPWAD